MTTDGLPYNWQVELLRRFQALVGDFPGADNQVAGVVITRKRTDDPSASD